MIIINEADDQYLELMFICSKSLGEKTVMEWSTISWSTVLSTILRYFLFLLFLLPVHYIYLTNLVTSNSKIQIF